MPKTNNLNAIHSFLDSLTSVINILTNTYHIYVLYDMCLTKRKNKIKVKTHKE